MQNTFEQELEICREKARRGQAFYEQAVNLESTDPFGATKLYYQAFLENHHGEVCRRFFTDEKLKNDQCDETLNFRGSLEDIFYRGFQAYTGIGRVRSYITAVQYFEYVANKKSKERSILEARYFLGDCYENGRGVEKNEQLAMEWFRKAAEQNHSRAQNTLGIYYEEGNGVEKNEEVAVEWYRKAAEQGYVVAQFNLGVSYEDGSGVEKNEEVAVEWYRKAAEQGYAAAQHHLGCCYEDGSGVEKNEQVAVEWYRKAAAHGLAIAQFNLGVCYENGRGVEKNEQVAVEWYRKAAEQGEAQAQRSLGLCYARGRSVDKNEQVAVEWYRKAAAQGLAIAQFNLGVCYVNGRGVAKNDLLAVEWYRKAAEQGDVAAQYNLGVCYGNGIGVDKNQLLGTEWLRKAFRNKSSHAKEALTGLYRNNIFPFINSAEEYFLDALLLGIPNEVHACLNRYASATHATFEMKFCRSQFELYWECERNPDNFFEFLQKNNSFVGNEWYLRLFDRYFEKLSVANQIELSYFLFVSLTSYPSRERAEKILMRLERMELIEKPEYVKAWEMLYLLTGELKGDTPEKARYFAVFAKLTAVPSEFVVAENPNHEDMSLGRLVGQMGLMPAREIPAATEPQSKKAKTISPKANQS